MSFFHSLLSSKGGTDDTTADGKQVFLVIGDSNANGFGESVPVVPADTLYLANAAGSSISEITTQSVSSDAISGSSWQQMAIDYKADTGKRTVLVQRGVGGSYIYTAGTNWYTSGTLYAPAIAAADATLVLLGLTKLKAIIINLGLNDVRAGTTDVNFETALQSLISRLTTKYPGIPILYVQVGRTETLTFSAGLYAARKRIVAKAEAVADMHVVGSGCAMVGAGLMNVDALHYTQAGYNHIGSMLARWFKNSAYTNKWSRSIISSHFDELSTARKGLINTFVSALHARGDLFELDFLSLFKTSTNNNIFNDWTFLGVLLNTSGTFVANSHIATNGSTGSYLYTYVPSISNRATQNDMITGVKIKTTVATAGSLFGSSNGASVVSIGQTGSAVSYRSNDATSTVQGEASMQAGNLYSTARNGTTKYNLKNKTVQHSVVVASTGLSDQFPRIGAYNNAGSLISFLNAEYEYCFAAKYTTFDFNSFFDDIETLIANW